jgi:hypothetical protein
MTTNNEQEKVMTRICVSCTQSERKTWLRSFRRGELSRTVRELLNRRVRQVARNGGAKVLLAVLLLTAILRPCPARPPQAQRYQPGLAQPLLPDPRLTPGATNGLPVEVVSAHGYTPTVRNVPESLKRQVFVEYLGRVPDKPGDYEVDHLISLELGGSNSISNLWPQSYLTFPYNSRVKDKLENFMARNVRATLAQQGHKAASDLLYGYQREIATNWIVAYEKYLGTNRLAYDLHKSPP